MGHELVACAKTQIFGHRSGVDDVAGIEDVLRDRRCCLTCLKRPYKSGPKKCFVEPTAGTAVPMFAGKCAAIAVQQIYRKVGDFRQLGHFGRFFGVDERADVQAAGAGVGVVGHVGADVVAETASTLVTYSARCSTGTAASSMKGIGLWSPLMDMSSPSPTLRTFHTSALLRAVEGGGNGRVPPPLVSANESAICQPLPAVPCSLSP